MFLGVIVSLAMSRFCRNISEKRLYFNVPLLMVDLLNGFGDKFPFLERFEEVASLIIVIINTLRALLLAVPADSVRMDNNLLSKV